MFPEVVTFDLSKLKQKVSLKPKLNGKAECNGKLEWIFKWYFVKILRKKLGNSFTE